MQTWICVSQYLFHNTTLALYRTLPSDSNTQVGHVLMQLADLETIHTHTVLATGHEAALLIGAELDSLDVVVADMLCHHFGLHDRSRSKSMLEPLEC